MVNHFGSRISPGAFGIQEFLWRNREFSILHQHVFVRRQELPQGFHRAERLAGHRSFERGNDRPVMNQKPPDMPDFDEPRVGQLPQLPFDE